MQCSSFFIFLGLQANVITSMPTVEICLIDENIHTVDVRIL